MFPAFRSSTDWSTLLLLALSSMHNRTISSNMCLHLDIWILANSDRNDLVAEGAVRRHPVVFGSVVLRTRVCCRQKVRRAEWHPAVVTSQGQKIDELAELIRAGCS